MPTYSIQAPDGNTYKIDGPAGASQQDVQAEVMRQHPTAGQAAAPPPAAPPSASDQLIAGAKNLYGSIVEPAAHFVTGMVAKPISDVAGLAATAHDAITGDQGDPAGFKQDVQDRLTYAPRTEGGKAATDVAGAITKPISAYTNWSGDFYSNALRMVGAPASVTDAVKNGETEAAGQVMNMAGEVPGQIVNAAKTAAGNALRTLEAKAAPRVQGALANAQATAPNLQTVAQTTGSPFLAKIGQGAAGAKTAEASASIVDKLAGGLTDQAKSIAPLGVSSPEVAGQVQKVLAQKDADLAQRAEAVYTSGRSAVAKDSGQVSTFNTVNAVDQMLAEARDPKVLAPPVVTKRLQGMIDTLRGKAPVDAPPGTGLASAPAQPAGTSWGGFYDLRKQINTLYDEVPKDQITPAMDQTFARLKAAYYQDLEGAPAGAAKNTTVKANQIYAGLAEEREVLKNSVVASVLGKDGKTSIANPDQVLDRLVGLPPAAQTYVRNILETYSPQTLDQLRSYAITKNVTEAGRTGAPATVSATEPRALTPGKLADSGLFTDAQVAELRSREDALRTALTALPEKGAPTAEVTPQSVGRLAGGGFSPTFLGGTLANVLSAGKLEKFLNTPEGRNALLAHPKSGATAGPTRMFTAAVLARAAQERNQQQSTTSPTPNGPPGNGIPAPPPLASFGSAP